MDRIRNDKDRSEIAERDDAGTAVGRSVAVSCDPIHRQITAVRSERERSGERRREVGLYGYGDRDRSGRRGCILHGDGRRAFRLRMDRQFPAGGLSGDDR